MMKTPPEISPRLTPSQTEDGQKIGPAVQLREKFRFLLTLGVFGPGADRHTICRLMYETSTIIEPSMGPKTTETMMQETVNDATAYLRFDNICRLRNAKSLLAEELDFLKRAYAHVFGGAAFDISDDLFLKGSAQGLIGALMGTRSQLDWSGLDPVLALEAIVAAAEESFPITLEHCQIDRWRKRDDWPAPHFPDEERETLHPGGGFKLWIEADAVAEAPIALLMAEAGEGSAEDAPVRAQLLPKAQPTDYGHGPWRISERGNKPFEVDDSHGRFAVLALSGLGASVAELFPSGATPDNLTDEDIEHFVTRLAEHLTIGKRPGLGLLRYRVVKPGEG